MPPSDFGTIKNADYTLPAIGINEMKSYTITIFNSGGTSSIRHLKAPSGGTYLFGSKGVVAVNEIIGSIQGEFGIAKEKTFSDFYIRLS